jgi:HD-like signal output (HDOD) protein
MMITAPSTELIPEELIAKLRPKMQRVQMLPGVAIQALEIARDPNCVIKEFVDVVQRDAKLASDILKLANSTVFAPGLSVVTGLTPAIMRLGLRQCRNLILSSGMTALMNSLSLEEKWIKDLLCRHGFLTGLLATAINRTANAGFQGEEFAAGLIHDFGRIIIATCLPSQFEQVDLLDFCETPHTLLVEKSLVGADHGAIGAWFTHSHQLPQEFVEVTRFHHQPESAVAHRRLVSLIAVSDHMANYLQRNEPIENYDVSSNEAVRSLERCGLPNVSRALTANCRGIMTLAKKDLQEVWSI